MKARRWLLTIICCSLLLGGLAGYKVMQIRSAIATAESFPEPSETVEAAIAERYEIQSETTTIGYTVAPQILVLRNELEGRIAEVNFASGSQVTQGQVLIQLDVSEEHASLQAAQARAQLARLNLKRVDKLRDSGSVSEERVDQARAELDIANADIQALKAVIAKKTLRAPFAARTGLHQLETGDYLQRNTVITTLVGISSEMWVDFTLPQHQAGLAVGAPARVVTSNGEALEGKIIARDSTVSAQSRNLRFRLLLDNASHLLPNSTVTVSVATGKREHWVRVPATAVTSDPLGSYVFVLEPEGDTYRARRRPVEVGVESETWVGIKSGLRAGELIAANGAFKLREGLKVFRGERPPTGDPVGKP